MEAIEFLKWCDTSMYRAPGELSFRLRCIPQYPDYDTYIVINKNGRNIFESIEKQFFTAEELYNYWLKHRDESK